MRAHPAISAARASSPAVDLVYSSPGPSTISAAVHPSSRSGLPPQPGEHAVILQILSRPVQGQGKQDPVSRPQVQLLRGADGPPLPVRQGVGEDTGQADVRLRPARVWMDQNDGHEIAFFKS